MLTARGGATVGAGLLAAAGAWILSLPELAAAGTGIIAVVLACLVWTWRPIGARPVVSRTVTPDALAAGGVATVEVTIRAPRRTGAVLITERVDDGRRLNVWAPPLRPDGPRDGRGDGRARSGGEVVARGAFPLPMPRRGIVTLGPLEVRRLDPLGLTSRKIAIGPVTTVTVWPRQVPAPPTPLSRSPLSGGAIEPLSDASTPRWLHRGEEEPDGLRAYVPGDELRRVHWTASARGRGLMVRTTLPIGRPMPLVVLDDRTSSHLGDSFELALVAVASILGEPGDPRPTTRVRLLSGGRTVTGLDALHLLTAAELVDPQPTSRRDSVADQHEHAGNWPEDSDLVVTGPVGDVREALDRRHGQPIVLRADPEAAQGARALALEEELAHWLDLAQRPTRAPR